MTDISALLLDSGTGWTGNDVPSYLSFYNPEFSVYSYNNKATRITEKNEKVLKHDPVEELQRNLDKGYVALGYIGYDFHKTINLFRDIHANSEKYPHTIPDTYFHYYREENVEKGDLNELEKLLPFNTFSRKRENPHIFPNISRDEYIELIRKARDYIASGDIYQVNISQMFSSDPIHDILSYGLELYQNQPVPYFGFIDYSSFQLISGSMELFLGRGNSRITSRPIKGTVKRSRNISTDRQLRDSLLNSAKERAENVMIVDLMRNDLGRICKYGSVNVPRLFDIKPFKTLYQMESEVSGTLRDDITIREIINSTFPPGSVTGAPKSRCLEIINELESHRRGPYCGAIGIFYPDGNFVLSVAIRIVVNKPDKSIFWVGGGIVWDSDPQSEYDETLLKAKAISKSMNRY